ncbi:HlyD family type I secretion periplasmic adaptor subunit [Kluyvera sichuanensis]
MRHTKPLLLIKGKLAHLRHYFASRHDQHDGAVNDVSRALVNDAPRIIRLTLWLMLAFIFSSLLWAGWAQLEEVTRGEGKTIPSSRLQKIQNLEGGILSELLVHEGQIVNAGDPLMRLDDTRFVSNVGETEADKLGLKARIERLTAEVNDTPLSISPDISSQAPEIAAGEEALFASRQNQFHSEIHALEQQKAQKQQELADFKSRHAQYQRTLNLQEEELKLSAPLIQAGAISQVEILRLKRSVLETRGQMDSAATSIPRTQSALAELDSKIAESRGRFQSEALSQLNEARTSLSKAEATGKALEDRVKRTLVTSPLRGIVQQIMVNTIGGVIQPGSDMIEIVPLEDNLLIETRIRPQDIAFLHPGQKAVIKFTAYDYTTYGGLDGTLEMISPDTITDKEGKSYYLIQLRANRNYLGTKEHPLLIIPGMVASVDIVTGHKSVLSYLLKPIIRAKAEALRER